MARITDRIFILALIYLNSLALFFVVIFLALHLNQSFELSATAIGGIVGAPIFLAGLASWIGGRIADRLGTLRVMRWGVIVFIGVAVVLWLSQSLLVSVVAILMIGLARILFVPASKALVLAADNGDGSMFRLRHIMIISAFGTVGIGSQLYTPELFRNYFALSALLGLVTLAWSSLRVNMPASIDVDDMPLEIPSLVRHERIAISAIVAFGFFAFFGIAQFESTLPVYLEHVLGAMGADVYRVEVTISSLATLIFALINNHYMTKFPNRFVRIGVIIGTGLSMVGMYLIFATPIPWVIYTGAVIYAMSEALILPAIDNLIAPFAKGQRRVQILGLVELRQMAFLIGPVVGGLLIDHAIGWLAITIALIVGMVWPSYVVAERASARR